MVLVKKKSNFYRAVIKLLGILFCSSSVHANTPRLFPTCRRPCWRRPSRKAFALRRATPTRPGLFPVCRRPCWRRPLRKAFVLRRATPTRPGFSRPAGVFVGADLSAKPLPFVGSRQHAPAFSGLPASLLAPISPQSLCPSLSHANTQKHRPKSMQYKTRGKRLYRFPLVLFLQKFVRAEIIQR